MLTLLPLVLLASLDFGYGAAISAHQTEGATGGAEAGDWWAFEHGFDPTSAALKPLGRKPIARNENADIAVDHWHRYDEDFALAAALGLKSVRISIAWEKVEPEPGRFSREALSHYRAVLRSMRRHGLEPMVALHHFTHPRWFHERGGWPHGASAAYFERYARVVVTALDDLCDQWISFNEPSISVHLGYISGAYPPNERSLPRAFMAGLSFVRAHQGLARWIHRNSVAAPDAPRIGNRRDGRDELGLVSSLQLYSPRNALSPLDHAAAWALDELANWTFLRVLLREPTLRETSERPDERPDWLGVNYYGRFLVGVGHPVRETPPRCVDSDRVADNGWCLYPPGLTTMLRKQAAQAPGVPLIVGENGLADAADALRPAVLRESLAAMDTARRGDATHPPVDVRAYFHWSLIDNFEWLHGYAHRFGLIGVERDLVRRPRASAAVYAAEIRRRSLNDKSVATPQGAAAAASSQPASRSSE